MENNQQNNNQKSSVRKKANILMLSGTLLFLIVGITIGGLMFRNSNLNKTNIQTLEKQLLSLKKLKDLQKTNEEKSKKLENQLESEKRALEGKLALKTTTEALNNELTNVKTELTNKDLTKAFNELFKKTPKYIKALKAYKVSEFENSPEYINALTAYKVSEFEKSPEYTNKLTAYKASEFIKTKAYKGALSVWTKNTKNEQLKTAFIDTETYKDLLKNHNQNQQLATEFKETLEHTTLSNPYKDAFKAYKVIKFEDTKTYANEFNAYKASEFIQTKAYKGALDTYKVNKSEFIKTNEYKTLLDTFKETKTSEEWKTAFIKTSKYRTPFNAFNVSEHEFIQTKEYKNAFASYLFSFKGKLDALKGALNTQKTDLEGKINDKLTKSELLKAINALDFDAKLKTKLTTALSEEFGKYTKSTELTTKLTGKADITALNGVKTELNNVKTELTNKDLTEAFNKLFKATPEYTTAFNAWIKTEKDNWKTSYASELNKLKNAKDQKKYNEFISKKPKNEATLPTNFNQMNKQGKKSIANNALYNYGKEMNKWMFSLVKNEYLTKFKDTNEYKNAFASYLFSFKGKLEALTGAVNKQKTDLNNELTNVKTELTNKDLTEAFNKLFKATPKYTKALKAYKVSQFKKSPEYTNKLTAYKVSQFKKSSEYTTALKNDYHKVPPFVEVLENIKIKEDELEAKQTYTNAFNKWKGTDESKNKKAFKSTDEYNAVLEQYKISKHENTKAYKGNLENHKNEFIKTNEYKTLLDTFKETKTSEEWKTAFIKTNEYTTPLSAYKVTEHEFIQTKAYKDAFSEYLFSFNEKLEAQKTQLESKINQKADITALNTQKSDLEGKINDKADITALNTQKSDLEGKINDKADITALNTQKTELEGKLATKEELKTKLTGKLTTSELLAKIKGLTFDDALKTKLTTALNKKFGEYTKSTELTTNYALKSEITKTELTELLNDVFAQKDFKLTDTQRDAIKNHLNGDSDFKNSIKGAKGDRGPKGDKGPQGERGPAGKDGSKGEDGKPGTDGQPGAKGDRGPQGLPGTDGQPGAQGEQGIQGEQGKQGPVGPQGKTGAQGPEGKQGPAGTPGKDGKPGTDGQPGAKGDRGPKGDKGPQGERGPAGAQGPAGTPGKDGKPGTDGQPGAKGDRGPQGLKGDKGDTGAQGPKGDKGDRGSPGKDADITQFITKNVFIKFLFFNNLVKEFQALATSKTDIRQNAYLNNIDGNKNSFYKLAPYVFESVSQANVKLNELLTGSLEKRNELAIWANANNFWTIGKLSELIKVNDHKYQKVIFQGNAWGTKGNENLYDPNSKPVDSAVKPKISTGPQGSTEDQV